MAHLGEVSADVGALAEVKSWVLLDRLAVPLHVAEEVHTTLEACLMETWEALGRAEEEATCEAATANRGRRHRAAFLRSSSTSASAWRSCVRWSVRDLARSSVVIGPHGHHLLCCRLRGLGKEEEA